MLFKKGAREMKAIRDMIRGIKDRVFSDVGPNTILFGFEALICIVALLFTLALEYILRKIIR
jgi:hypothetical protein